MILITDLVIINRYLSYIPAMHSEVILYSCINSINNQSPDKLVKKSLSHYRTAYKATTQPNRFLGMLKKVGKKKSAGGP